MENGGIVRACLDVHRIGKMVFGVRVWVLDKFMKKYQATQRYQDTFGAHTFYVVTNHSKRAWLFNVSKVHDQDDQVGGFYQVGDKTFVLPCLDFALVPNCMYPKNGDFSFLNIQVMFMWMSR